VVTICTTCLNVHRVHLFVPYGSHNKQRPTLTDWSLQRRRNVFPMRYGLNLCILFGRNWVFKSYSDSEGRSRVDGVEYLHRSPASRRRRRKRNPVPGRCNRANLFLEDINMVPWPSSLRESRIWDSKIWSCVPRDSDLRMSALARTSSNCKRQTHPLMREDVT
jgi:hypothetical protein